MPGIVNSITLLNVSSLGQNQQSMSTRMKITVLYCQSHLARTCCTWLCLCYPCAVLRCPRPHHPSAVWCG